MKKWLHTSVNTKPNNTESTVPSEKEVSAKIEEKIKQLENYGWILFSYNPIVTKEGNIEHFMLFYSEQQ
jgi:predicted rRNA methylase YqxC with S4 and FtsJ domains